MTTLFAMVGTGSVERPAEIYPGVRIKLVKAHGVCRVKSCLVWIENRLARFLESEESYESTAAAYAEMKRRVMNLLWESGMSNNEREVNWIMESE